MFGLGTADQDVVAVTAPDLRHQLHPAIDADIVLGLVPGGLRRLSGLGGRSDGHHLSGMRNLHGRIVGVRLGGRQGRDERSLEWSSATSRPASWPAVSVSAGARILAWSVVSTLVGAEVCQAAPSITCGT